MIGIDDAGRGVILGPMIVAGVKATERQTQELKALGVKDSKRLSEIKLIELSKEIKRIVSDFCIMTFPARRLNKRDKKLDDFERDAIDGIVLKLGGGEAIADFVSRPHLVKHAKVEKGAERHTEVAAASILASATYILAMRRLKKEYGNIGSGNTNDPITIEWLKNTWKREKSWPEIVRTFYKTIERLENE